MTRRIAFVGLGAMGMPMARNLVKAGFDPAGFDLNPVSMSNFEANGGQAAPSAAAAAKNADVLILMVVNAAQAETALFASGALGALAPMGVVVLMATRPSYALLNATKGFV